MKLECTVYLLGKQPTKNNRGNERGAASRQPRALGETAGVVAVCALAFLGVTAVCGGFHGFVSLGVLCAPFYL